MPRRLSSHDLTRFLGHLAQTGNLALAAERTGRSKSVIYKHRARSPAFATRCEAALTLFRANHPAPRAAKSPPSEGEDDSRVERERGEGSAPPPRTSHLKHQGGGELRLHHSRTRPPQLRRAQPGHLTPAGIAAFLRALSATANIRLSAQSVGVAASSVHARRRRDPAFAEEWDSALQLGCDRLELALIERATNFMEGVDTPAPAWESSGLDPWDDETAPPHPEPAIAAMTVDDALRLLRHHTQKKRRAQAPYVRAPTWEEVAPRVERKVNALKRQWREEGE